MLRLRYAEAEIALRRALSAGAFKPRERQFCDRLLAVTLSEERSYRCFARIEDLCAVAGIVQEQIYSVLNPLVHDRVIDRFEGNCFGFYPDPAMWAPGRQPARRAPEIAELLARGDAVRSDRKAQCEFWEWPRIAEGMREASLNGDLPAHATGCAFGGGLLARGGAENAPRPEGGSVRGEPATASPKGPPGRVEERTSWQRPGGPADTTDSVVVPGHGGGDYHEKCGSRGGGGGQYHEKCGIAGGR